MKRKTSRSSRSGSPKPPISGGFVFIIIASIAIVGAGIASMVPRPPDPTPTPTPTPTPIPTPTPTPTESRDGLITPKTLDEDKPNGFIEPVISDPSCVKPSRADYILNGDYSIAWTVGGRSYEGILRMSQDRGKLGIKYFNQNIKKEDVVIQDMRLMNCTRGLLILGYNPRRLYTNSRHPTYYADNFVIRGETYGEKFKIVNVDDQNVHAAVELTPIK